jgi:DNA repair protein RadD
MIELRPYQIEVIGEVQEVVAAGHRRLILVVPTGGGKTVVSSEIVKGAVADGQNVLVLAHTREIIRQTSLKLYGYEIEHGIIAAGLVEHSDRPVQVASIQTLWSRAMLRGTMRLPPADLLIIDEAHHCPATSYRKIVASYPNAIVLGLTATPCRGDGRGLGGIFDVIVESPQVPELIKQGFLVKTRVFAPVDPDLTGVGTSRGDYIEHQLAGAMDRNDLVGDIIGHWHRYGERRKTVCFAVSVAHSAHICNEFKKSGVRAEHVDGSTPKAERDAILARLASGETELVTNCMVLTEGWDLPEVSCCILARPTKKMGLFRQMIGRVLRPAPGKRNAIVLDHSGAVFRHGFVEDPVEWTLDEGERATSPAHTARLNGGSRSRLVECKACGSVRTAGEPCEHCGWYPKPPPDAVVFRDGDLVAVDRNSCRPIESSDPHVRMRWHAMLAHIGNERGYKPGWASYKFKERFGMWPASRYVSPQPPLPEVLSWVRSRNIAYAKAREKERPPE